MLEVSRRLTISSNGSPAILKHVNFSAAEVNHGFDGEAHPWFKEGTATTTSKIRDLWELMHSLTDAVPNEFANDSIVVALDEAFDSIRNVANSITGSGKTNCIIERFAGGVD